MTEITSSRLYSDYKYIWKQKDNTLDSIYVFIQDYHVTMDDAGNITVTNTDKIEVPAFCCHLDTVHSKAPEPELIANDIITSFCKGGGIGGDDKCGIIACLELLKAIPCKCIFFRSEEHGCVGSREYDTETLKDNLFLIEIDRKGGKDLIFNSGGKELCDDKFKEEIKKYFPHGEEAEGFMTDVNVLGDAGINMMNLSAGYYNPHHDNEYVILSELERNIECLIKFATDYKEARKFERKEMKLYEDYRQNQRSLYPGYGYEAYDRANEITGDIESGEDTWYRMQYGQSWRSVKEEDERDLQRWLEQVEKQNDPKKSKGK